MNDPTVAATSGIEAQIPETTTPNNTPAIMTTTTTQFKEFKCKKVPQDILSQMVIYNSPLSGKTVLELSKKYRLMVILLRHLGCIFCRYAVAQVSRLYKTFLQCGTIPIFVHAEPKDVADYHFSNYEGFTTYQPVAKSIFRVQDPTGELFYDSFGVRTLRFDMKLLAQVPKALKTMKKITQLTGMKQDDHFNKYKTREQAFFVVEKGAVTNACFLENFYDYVDYEKLLMDPERNGCTSEVCGGASLQQIVQDTGAFSGFLDKMEDHMIHFSQARKKWYKSGEIIENDIAPDYSQVYTLREVMQSDDMRRFFKLYAMKEMSIENILFYEQVKQYEVTEDQGRLKTEAVGIFDTFIDPQSHLQINLGSNLMNKYRRSITLCDTFTSDLFKELLLHIETTNLADTYARFVRSGLYAEMIEFCHNKLKH